MRLSFIILITLILIPFSSADIEGDKALNWLLSQQVQGSYDNDIIATSSAILALKNAGYSSQVEESVDYLSSQKNSANCWPKLNCRIKDTAFALLALSAAGEPVDDIIEWLENAQSSSTTKGKWLLQIANAENGQCSIKYNKGQTEITKQVVIEDGKFQSCNNNNWLDLNSCLEPNLLSKYPLITFDIDCNNLDSNAIIVLLFNVGNTYTFVENIESSSGSVTVDNNCYGTSFKGTCNLDSTLYTSYALSKIDKPSSIFFLKSNYDSNNPEHLALLSLITQDQGFIEDLESRQRNDGSFDNSVIKTSLALMTLNNNQEAIDWLESKQDPDGSFGDIFETSFALLALSPTTLVPTCSDNIKNQGEEGIDCGGPCSEECGICNLNDVCDEELGEDSDNCPSDCIGAGASNLCKNGKQDNNEEGIDCGGSCSAKCPSCNNDGICEFDTFGETALQCQNDCSCGDKVCDSTENDELSNTYCPQDCKRAVCNDNGLCELGENEDNCPNDCTISSGSEIEETEEESSFPFVSIIVIIVIGLIIVFSIYYFTKKKGKKPEFNLFGKFGKGKETKENSRKEEPLFKPEIPKFPGSKPSLKSQSKLDEELEKSLEEARKLIKKK